VKKNIALSIKKAFTLIELLIVVAIIGILAGVGIPMYNGYMADAKINAVKKQHSQIVSYLSAEFQKCHMGNRTIFQDTWKKNQENCPIPFKNAVLRASASDTLSDKMGNVYLGSGRSAFESATQKGLVRPCSTSVDKQGCHEFNYSDYIFTIKSYYDDDGDITDKDSDPDFKKTVIRTN
jgi:prepilin-type N-terminal cleavage/methylation domain-containing protein